MSYIDETYGKQLEEALRGLVSRPALGQPWFGFHESEVPAGVLLFTATTHSRVLYADFWKYIQDKNLVKTEEEWQSIYNEQGWCPFYSDGDGIDTFRMPILEESEKLVGVWAISAPQQPIPDATVEGIISELGVASNNALEAKNGLNGVVRSVNGVNADAAGDVELFEKYVQNYNVCYRFPNGLQFEFGHGTSGSFVSFIKSFKENPRVMTTHNSSTDENYNISTFARSLSATRFMPILYSNGTLNTNAYVHYFVIGHWK